MAKSKNRIENKAPQEAVKNPTTQADFYAVAWGQEFRKLTKPEQTALTENLNAKPFIVREKEIPHTNVIVFVRGVADLGESLYQKHLDKVAKQTVKAA